MLGPSPRGGGEWLTRRLGNSAWASTLPLLGSLPISKWLFTNLLCPSQIMAESKNHKSVRTGGRWLQGLGCFGIERHKGFLFVSLYSHFPYFLSLVFPINSLATVEEESFMKYAATIHCWKFMLFFVALAMFLKIFPNCTAQVPHTTSALVQEVLEAKPSGAKSLKKVPARAVVHNTVSKR